MKEYDQQIVELKNENFNLKLRIYFLEERLQHKFGDSDDNVHKSNIELKIEVESLKKELNDKQELLVKASSALEAMETSHKSEIDEMNAKFEMQRRNLEEEISRLQMELQNEQEKAKSSTTEDDGNNREELYQQAFAPFIIPAELDLKEKNCCQEKIDKLCEELKRLNSELLANHDHAKDLEKCIAEKDTFIKEEEIRNVKRHKSIQGLITALTAKEKQFSQLQEQLEMQSLELHTTKEKLNNALRNEVANSSADIFVHGRQQETSEEQKEKSQDHFHAMKEEFHHSLETKDDIVSQLQSAISKRNSILQKCLQLLGGIFHSDEITDSSIDSVVEIFKVKLEERESQTQIVFEKQLDLIKEKDTELMHLQENLMDLKGKLYNLEKRVEKLQSSLTTRDSKIEDMLQLVRVWREEKLISMEIDEKTDSRKKMANKKISDIKEIFKDEPQNKALSDLCSAIDNVMKENDEIRLKLKKKEELVEDLKAYLGFLVDDPTNLTKLSDRHNWSGFGTSDSDASFFEKKLTDLEYRVRTTFAKNKLLDNQLTSVKERAAVIRKLIDGIQNGSGDRAKAEFNYDKDLEENMQAVLRGVKLMTNLNDLFRQQIELNYETSRLNDGKLMSNAQKFSELSSEAHQETSPMCVSCQNGLKAKDSIDSAQLENRGISIGSKGGSCDGDCHSPDCARQRDAQVKTIESLKQKLFSTENTVHLLGSKVKYYRKLLHDYGGELVSPGQTPPSSDKPHQSKVAEQGDLNNRKTRALSMSRRSVSANELWELQDGNKSLIDDNQALSAEDVLAVPLTDEMESERPFKLTIAKPDHVNILTNGSPYTPDSLLDYGRSSDVLELKEQVCRLKLLLEQRESQMSELYSEREIGRAMSLTRTESHLSSLLKEQSLTPSENTFSIYYPRSCKLSSTANETRRMKDVECQVGEGIVRRIEHRFQNVDEELQWLQSMNAMMHNQVEVLIGEIPHGRYSAYIQLQQQDITMLKNRLLDSHDACELLRVRLEELAEFLEELLRFDENGFLDTSQFTPQRVESLKRRIAESRELSHSLSHSLLIDVADVSNVTSCQDSAVGPESPNSSVNGTGRRSNVNMDTHERSQLSKTLNTQAWILSGQNVENRQEKCIWQVSEKREIDWQQLTSRDGSFHKESINSGLRTSEPTKLNAQSSCDDMILLLNTSQHIKQQQPINQNSLYHQDDLSADANSEAQKRSSSSTNQEIRALDEFREEAIMAEYVRHYTSKQFDGSDNRSSYHRTSRALSLHRESIEQDKIACSSRGRVASPSGSESWSEPDRTVSQLRIGLELCDQSFLSKDKSLVGRSPRSLKMKNRSSSNDESTTENSLTPLYSKAAYSPASNRKYRHETLLVEKLQLRLKSVMDLNQTLKSELQICQALHVGVKQEDRGLMKTNEGNSKDGMKRLEKDPAANITERRRHSSGDKLRLISNEQLMDLRKLRMRLEELILTNDKLNEKLEKRVAARKLHIHRDDEDIHRLTLELSEKEQLLAEQDRQLQYHCHKESEFQLETNDLQQQVLDLTEKLKAATSRMQQLENDVIDRDDGSRRLKEASQRLQKSIGHLQTALADKERVVKELRETNGRMQRTLETVNGLMIQHSTELNETREENERLRDQKEKMNETYKKEMDEMKYVMMEKESELEEKMNAINRSHQEQLSTFAQQIDKKDEETKELRKSVTTVTEQLENKKQDCCKLELKFEELKKAVAQTEKQLEDEHGLCLSLQQKVVDLGKEVSTKDDYLEDARLKLTDLESMLNTAEKDYLEQRDKADRLQSSVDDRDEKIGQLENVVEKLKLIIEEKKAILERQLENALSLEQKTIQLSQTAMQKEARWQEEKTNIAKLEDVLRNVEKELKRTQEDMKAQTQQLRRQESIYEDLQVKLDQRSTTIRNLEDELHKTLEENEKLQQKALSAQASLMETNELNKSMKTQLSIYEHLHENVTSPTKATAKRHSSNQNSASVLDVDLILTEMRYLRTQLELSIQTNNALRAQLEDRFISKSDETVNAEKKWTKDDDVEVQCRQPSQNGFSLSVSDVLPVRRDCANAKEDKSGDREKGALVRQHSKSSDYVCEEKTSEKCGFNAKRKAEGMKLQLPELTVMPIERTPSDQLDSHCIYSSPDLGIESDPSHFSSLERKMSDITEGHLWDIQQEQKDLNKSVTPHYKLGSKIFGDDQLLYAIGFVYDYEVLKKEMEAGIILLKSLQSRIRERLQSCPKNYSIQNVEHTTLKELHSKSNNLNVSLGKCIKVIGCFWKAVLPSTAAIQSKNPKLVEENLLLKKKLHQQKSNLEDALTKLDASNRLKEEMEKAIIKQLTKTHDVLKRAKGNLEGQTSQVTN